MRYCHKSVTINVDGMKRIFCPPGWHLAEYSFLAQLSDRRGNLDAAFPLSWFTTYYFNGLWLCVCFSGYLACHWIVHEGTQSPRKILPRRSCLTGPILLNMGKSRHPNRTSIFKFKFSEDNLPRSNNRFHYFCRIATFTNSFVPKYFIRQTWLNVTPINRKKNAQQFGCISHFINTGTSVTTTSTPIKWADFRLPSSSFTKVNSFVHSINFSTNRSSSCWSAYK